MSTPQATKDEAEAKAPRMLELQLPLDPNGHPAAFVPVRWCVYKPLIEQISRFNFKKPYLFIVVRAKVTEKIDDFSFAEFKDTDAHIVPMKAWMQFVSFSRPGDNEVCAMVFEMSDSESAKHVRAVQRAIRRGSSKYNSDSGSVFEANGRAGWSLRESLSYIDTRDAVVKVNVPKQMFAKEPPKWLNNIVSFFFEGKGRNQCAFRRRAITSVLLAPLVSGLMNLIKLGSLAVVLILGLRLNDARWRQFIWPLRGTPADLHPGTPVWWTDKKGRYRFGPFNFINPIVIPAITGIAYGVSQIPWGHGNISAVSWWECLGWVAASLAGIGAVILLAPALFVVAGATFAGMGLVLELVYHVLEPPTKLIAAWSGWDKLGNGLDKVVFWRGWRRLALLKKAKVVLPQAKKPAQVIPLKVRQARIARTQAKEARRRAADRERQEQEAARKRALEAELAALTCRAEAMSVDVDALPPDKQTLVLRYNDFKQKVCKPFAA